MKTRNKRSTRGFTLIEAIVVLVVVSICGTFFWTFMGKAFLQSSVPRQNVVRAKDLNQVMENIRADYNYRPCPVWKPSHNYALGDTVIPTALSPQGQRFWYKCTQATEISGSSEPAWITGTGTVPDGATGNLIWTGQGALTPMTLSDLYGYIGVVDTVNKKCASNPIPPEKCYDKSTNQYGYYVTEKNWIYFDTNNTAQIDSINQNILKVTISAKDDSGNTVAMITTLFF